MTEDQSHDKPFRSLDRAEYCPVCRYDMRGIDSDRCPECDNDDFSPRMGLASHDAGRVTIRFASTCTSCKSELADDEMTTCPQCGDDRMASITFGDAPTYHRAKAALDEGGLLVGSTAFGGSLGSIGVVCGFSSASGALFVAARTLDVVDECLERNSIAIPVNARPIVDTSEPFCPQCDARVDPAAPPRCAQCGCAFHWVEIDEVDPDSGVTADVEGERDPRNAMVGDHTSPMDRGVQRFFAITLGLLAAFLIAAFMLIMIQPDDDPIMWLVLFASSITIGFLTTALLNRGMR